MIDCIVIDCIVMVFIGFLNCNNSITLTVHLPIFNFGVLTTYYTDNYFGA